MKNLFDRAFSIQTESICLKKHLHKNKYVSVLRMKFLTTKFD